MILRALVLEDVGAYAGCQRLEFAPPSPRAPVTLIGGLNGSGKTTILWAILHALYGPLAGPVVGRRGRYEGFLRQWMHGEAQRSAVTLELALALAGEQRELSVRREWRLESERLQESVSVTVDGRPEPALSAAWAETIEAILPRSVARLFFFDGEKVEALADLERARDTLRVAIGSLLGLDLVDQLTTDLKALRTRETTAAAGPREREEVGELSEAVEQARQDVERAMRTLAERMAGREAASRRLEKVNRRFQAAGGPIYEQQAALAERRRAAEERLARAHAEACEFAAGWAPLLLVGGRLGELHETIEGERAIQRAAELNGVLERRDLELLEWIAAAGVQRTVHEELSARLAGDREEREQLGRTPRSLNAEEACAVHVGHLLHGGLRELAGARERLLTSLEQATLELEEAQRMQAMVPDALGIEAILAERDSLELEVAQANGECDGAERDLARVRKELDKREARLKRRLEQLAQDEGHEDGRRRLLKHAQRAQETLVALRERAVERHLERIERAIEQALGELLHKHSLVGGVTIQPATFELCLRTPDGGPLSTDRLSAGERQLVAQAMLWGLARAAQRPIPAVIDTPLGRLDASHRSHVVERYLPHAGHQVVVLSTDTELVDAQRELLGARVGREYLLEFDDELGETTIRPGYFAAAAAA